jgi:hypothetical protein
MGAHMTCGHTVAGRAGIAGLAAKGPTSAGRRARKQRVLVAALVTALALTALALAAGAQPAAAHGAPAPAPWAVAGKPVPLYDAAPGGAKDYEVVESGSLSDWAGVQTHDEVVCPANKLPVGGGAQILSSSLGENLASSYPTTEGWAVDVNNATMTDGLFDIYAVWANPEGYDVLDYHSINWAGNGGGLEDGCTTGTKVLAGGARANTADLNVSIRDSFPVFQNEGNWPPGKWLLRMNNLSTQNVDLDEFVICAKVKHTYQVITGQTSIDRAGTREQLNDYCPTGTRPLSGGAEVPSGDGVTLNSTFPWPTGWSTMENNTSSEDATFTVHLVCE